MKTIELSTTNLNRFNLTLHEGKAVVRNQSRISALIGVRYSLIPEQYHHLLAKVSFAGNQVDEQIVWTTDVFREEPQPLSKLAGEEKDRYAAILQDALQAYALAFAEAEEGVKGMLYAAITYGNESSVYCGDNRVVITEWGMSPKGNPKLIGMPLSIDDFEIEAQKSARKDPAANPAGGSRPDRTESGSEADRERANLTGNGIMGGAGEPKSAQSAPSFQNDRDDTADRRSQPLHSTDTVAGSEAVKSDDDASTNSRFADYHSEGMQKESTDWHVTTGDESAKDGDGDESIRLVPDNGGVDVNGENGGNEGNGANGGNDGNDEDDRKRSNFWHWLVPLLLLLAALPLVCWFTKGCASGKDVLPVTPAIDSSQVVLSKDSLRYVVNNRLLLLLTKDNATIDDFAKQFRAKYKDEERYVLSNPDTLIKRVTLTLPEEERDSLEEKLPLEFQEFGLVVIPETMYKHSYKAKDPGFNDPEMSWYFDECSVFDAWDVTMGSDQIVVAVIDDEFDLNHQELKGKIIKPYNAVFHNDYVTPSPSGHGTHVAATAIGSADNGNGTSGIAPRCLLTPIQIGDPQGNMTTSAILDAVIYAISNGADVVNMSLGMSFGPFVQFAPLYIQKNFRANMFLQEERVWNHLFNIATRNNISFVLAAGNENCLVGLDPMQRSPNTIKVSAVQPDKQKAAFSNYGDMSTVSAPGVRIFNAIPGNRYTYMDGTSMAAPIVAGGCALLKSKDPNLSVTELIRILRKTGQASPSDVGPIVNFAKALGVEFSDVDDCSNVSDRYNELLAELQELERQHPECVQRPDTLSIPDGLTIDQLTGRWKSTTSLYNKDEETVVLYFTFNGTSEARLDIVEPDGSVYMASLLVSIANEQIFIDQPEPARSLTAMENGKSYNPYRFILKPGRDRKADGEAKNKVEVANEFVFNLIKI